ncbi:hypothetical protein ACTXIX_07090 [Glutamicibacter ardleyensis]|uniref:hypothetical protein n=1 Tax=Glutamicibacter ardleyensis TaxID=225894 RepID=UPI003FCFBC4B
MSVDHDEPVEEHSGEHVEEGQVMGVQIPGRWHPEGLTLEEDLALLASGEGTGWWDESGRPAPWPQDFLDPAAGWSQDGVLAVDWVQGAQVPQVKSLEQLLDEWDGAGPPF